MNMEAEGRHALLFDDDATAAFVNSRAALVPWNDDASLLIDRYDVRHLLDRIPARPPQRKHLGRSPPSLLEDPVGVSQSELDLERYLDLPPPGDDGGEGGDSVSETIKRSEATSGGAYQAVPFAYGSSNSVTDPKYSDFGLNNSGFHPPFPVPESLLSNLPPTEKLHQIIARTAIFISKHGGQSEIVLRVKQGDNPTFGFLMPDHHLHAYFRYLVGHPHILNAEANSSTTEEDKKSDDHENESRDAAGGALSLLGSVYGSGEDDDVSLQADYKEKEPAKSNIAGNAVIPQSTEKGESSISTASEDQDAIKHPVAAAVKEKTFSPKRKHSTHAASGSAAGSKKLRVDNASLHGAMGRMQNSQLGISDVKPLILEPPSSLKMTMDKIVEFILRNGKEFESVLIEQDKTTGRFPFLLPSNQYHSYYLKILTEARELKLIGKNLSDRKNDGQGRVGSKNKKQEAPDKESTANDSTLAEQSDGWYDLQRKEKFKMIIGGPKKDTHGQRPPLARHSGVSTNEAAAIVLAATRGLSPANALQSISADELGTVGTPGDSGRASSVGSIYSLQGHNPVLKPPTIGKLEKDGCGTTGDVSVAKAIAETVALVTSNEADSSEASLTKEQKLKAERLKRAKMFAVMIKGGNHGITAFARSGSFEASNAGSIRSAAESDLLGKETEGSSVPIDAEISDRTKYEERGPVYGHNREHRSSKKHLSMSRDHEKEEEEDDSQSRKKHRSEHSSHHSRDRHKHHRKSHSSSKDKESRHRHKYRSSSEDEHPIRRSSRNDLSEDEDGERKGPERHRRRHHSHAERKRELEGEGEAKTFDQAGDVSLSSASHRQEVGMPAAGSDAQPPDAPAAPSDFRAKIRAMLLETM